MGLNSEGEKDEPVYTFKFNLNVISLDDDVSENRFVF